MSHNKTYYYIRLKENFYDEDAIILLESMPDGMLYSNILLKLYLKSLRFNGQLRLTEEIAYTSGMIATITRHNVGTVEKALTIFCQLGLMEQLTDGSWYMTNIQEMIGQSSTEGDRKRAARARLQEQGLLDGQQGGHLSDKRPPELELRDRTREISPHNPPEQGGHLSESCPQPVPPEAATGGFEAFWRTYPRKEGKAAAEKAWKRLAPDPELTARIMEAVGRSALSEQWQRENGRYIPAPARWLNQRRWEDGAEPVPQIGTGSAPSYDLAELEQLVMAGAWGKDRERSV